MFPLELVELIIHYAWGCISTSSHRHAHSMTKWMLASRDWLNIVVSVVFRNLWITSPVHLEYILHICRSNTSFVCRLAGIMDIHEHLAQTCRSLTISVYHIYEEEYAFQCTDLIEYATADPHGVQLLPGAGRYRTQEYAIPSQRIAAVIRDFVPQITVLHFVLLDCTATYGAWTVTESFAHLCTEEYPLSLTELHVAFAYTSPPQAFLLDAPRGTFFPPPCEGEIARCWFNGIRKLVVWDANADFVAFMTTVCPRLERVESTAEFRVEDVPEKVPEDVKDRLVFVRLPRTVTWGLTGSDTEPIPENWPPTTIDEWQRMSRRDPFAPFTPVDLPSIPRRNPLTPIQPSIPSTDLTPATSSKATTPRRKTLWRLLAHVFRESMS
ncbi:hypothetical protein DFH06DRAFT_1352727 [Mycena polygramma]|nr:hypothetical protein DFH06DRAFT_1352727 [Mycena polygramma]